jgi:3-keto-L-gulonate-6-phosphate decarboxylase
MKDERSIKAVDVAIAFGEGKASRKELDAACANATTHASYAYAADAAATTHASYAYAAAADAATAACAYAAAAADAACAYAKKENQQLTADLCRKYLPIEIWNI